MNQVFLIHRLARFTPQRESGEGKEMAIRALNESEIAQEMKKAPLWKLEGKEIVRVFQFRGFLESIGFVTAIAVAAEKADHHPDILIQYSRVTLRLSTHDCNGLSSRDFALAAVADQLAAASATP
jgi:4a-hydroxytetrahydrobiopterin dehydratase